MGQPRVATEDVEVGGVRIRRGEAVYVSYVAANGDESCYPEPGRIDIDRQGRPHLAFGYGPHHCVAPRAGDVHGSAHHGVAAETRS
ncbi:cytochrome P450 [Streptomyces sp. NPDC056387]|uniref:cytochrome P450 n=1 Tax=Streptomyces sp. NPDC056387 TaxID=3345803 RepID=UPI0035E25EE8